MIFVICAVIGLIVGVILAYKEWDWDILMFFYGLIGAFLGFLVGGVLWFCIAVPLDDHCAVVNTEEVEIHALVDNAKYSSVISGSVFIVQSRTNEELKYSYMYKEEGKGFGFAEVDADHSYINYTKEQPRVKILTNDYDNAFLRWLLPNIYCKDYLFYIPEDSQIIDDFTIDFGENLGVTLNRRLYDPETIVPDERAKQIEADKSFNVDSSLSDSLPAGGVAVYTTLN